jgi:oxygen-independent coproporphyrinogen-3 oxidase
VGNYENVGFSLPGFEGLYNIYMMEEIHSIFAAGAGAVTKLVDRNASGEQGRNIERLFHQKYPYEYLREDKGQEILARAEQFYEEQGMLS